MYQVIEKGVGFMKNFEKGSVTIRTIAEMANVSHTTVSRALNGSELVKPLPAKDCGDCQTNRLRSQSECKKFGHEPFLHDWCLFFTNLDTGTSASFLTEVMQQSQTTLPKSYSLSVNSIDHVMNSQGVSVQNFDGIIVLSQSESDDEFIDYIHSIGLPLVVLNRKIERNDITNFSHNDFLGAKNVVEYAIRMGHRNFGLIKGVKSFESSKQRSEGFFEALKEHRLEVDSNLVKRGDYLPKAATS